MFGIEGRYAHATYSAAAKKKSVEKVEEELNEIQVFGAVWQLDSCACDLICVCGFRK